MLSAHPSSYLPHHTHTHTHTHTHRVPADPTHTSMLKKLLFLFYFRHVRICAQNTFPIAISSVQWLSQFWLSETLLCAAHQASLSITNSQSLLKIQAHQDGDAIQPSHPLTSPSPLAFNLSLHQGLFQGASLCLRWPKYWSFSISPFNEYSGLISSSIDCIDFLAIQGTLESLPQHHSSKPSVLQCSAFFMVQLSHAYLMTVGKT